MSRVQLASAAALVLAALAGCGGASQSGSDLPPAVAAAVRSDVPADPGIVAADNTFAFGLLSQLETSAAGKNVFISPASVALALDVEFNGARGSTMQAMATALQLPASLAESATDLNQANVTLLASLYKPDPSVELDVANSLWVHRNQTTVAPAFIQADTQYYGATLGDLSAAPGNINSWASAQTHGKITSIAPQVDYSQIVSVVVNTVYFKGPWTSPFDPSATLAGKFTLLDGTQVDCPMMHQLSSFVYEHPAGLQIVRLPYGSGRLSMYLLLPDPGTGWSAFLAQLTYANWTAWMSGMPSSGLYGEVGLPRFTLSYSANLKPSLTALGMGVAFQPGLADLSGIAPDVFVAWVQHATYLQVDEEGTVAAGATSVGSGASGEIGPAFNMQMDRPFACAIRDDKSGALLFLGTIVNPQQGS